MNSQERKDIAKFISHFISQIPEKDQKKIVPFISKFREEDIPISVFNADLSTFEIFVKFLKENKGYSFKKISSVLKRETSTIYKTYSNSLKKSKGPLDVTDYSITIPENIISDRNFSPLESLVHFLKTKHELPLVKISKLLSRSYSTVITTERRYLVKADE